MAKMIIIKSSEIDIRNLTPEYYFKKYPKRVKVIK